MTKGLIGLEYKKNKKKPSGCCVQCTGHCFINSINCNYFIFYFFKTNQCFHQYINLCFKQSVKGMYYCTNIPHSHELFLTLPT